MGERERGREGERERGREGEREGERRRDGENSTEALIYNIVSICSVS